MAEQTVHFRLVQTSMHNPESCSAAGYLSHLSPIHLMPHLFKVHTQHSAGA